MTEQNNSLPTNIETQGEETMATDNLMMPEVMGDNGRAYTTSRAIAEYFDREHKNVLRDIQQVIAKCPESFNALNFEPVKYTDTKGEQRPMYKVFFDGFMLVVMGYTGEKAMQMKLAYIEAFNKMREKLSQSNLPQTYAEALRMLANEVEAKELAEKQRDEAIRTKAWIGNKREATAMATASVATRKVYALENKLGEGKTYKQVKAITWLSDFFVPCKSMYIAIGKHLSKRSKRLGYDTIQVPTPEYPQGIKAYHVNVIEDFYYSVKNDKHFLESYRIIQ